MAWEFSGDVERFGIVAGDFLRARPVAHTVFLTLVDNLRRRGLHAYGERDPLFGWWCTQGEVTGVLLCTPPHPLLVSGMPIEAVRAAADVLPVSVDAANLPVPVAATFTDAWQQRTGRRASPGMRTRLYRLEALHVPEVPGHARPATGADLDLIVGWTMDFHEFLGEPGAAPTEAVAERSAQGGVTLWEDGGEPVSMAMRSEKLAGMVRVLTVWTPERLRGRGYAAGATAAASRAALDDGAEHVVLFTDLDYPISNRLYQRLGYRPLEDRTVVRFS